MSIEETKLYKESVETPVLKTNDIEYMGFTIPMYDVVENDFIPSNIEQDVQLNKNTSSNKDCGCIRILPNTNLFEKIGIMTLTGISLFSHAKQGNQNFVVLCVYAKKNGQYKFIGHSTNPFLNSNNAIEMIFQFDNLNLFESIQKDGDIVYAPYREVFIKPLILESTQYDKMISEIENPDWNNELFTTLRLEGCSNTHNNFSPYLTDYDLTFGPHVKMKFKTGNYVVGDKIPHNSNGVVHLSPSEKQKVIDLYNLSISYFNDSDTEKTLIPIDTRLLDQQYNRTNGQIMCSFTIDPTDYVGKTISELRFRHAVNTDKRMVNKYLQADCYDESGALIDTFFSIEPKSQTATETGETTFQFYDNFIIKEDYKNIQFRISPSNVERANATYYSFAGSSLRNSQTNDNDSKYRAKDGWILKWLNGAPVSGTNPLAQNNLTPDFTIIFGSREIIKGSGFIKHINNNDIHVTADEKQSLLDLLSIDVENEISPQQKNPETSYNYTKHGFVVKMEDDVTIEKLTLYCNDTNARGGDVYAMIWKSPLFVLESDNVYRYPTGEPTFVTSSLNTQTHGANAILEYNFDKFDVKNGDYVAVAFKSDKENTNFSGFTEVCFRVVDLEYNPDDFKGGILGAAAGVWAAQGSTTQHKYMVKHVWKIITKVSIKDFISDMKSEIQQLRTELEELKGNSSNS